MTETATQSIQLTSLTDRILTRKQAQKRSFDWSVYTDSVQKATKRNGQSVIGMNFVVVDSFGDVVHRHLDGMLHKHLTRDEIRTDTLLYVLLYLYRHLHGRSAVVHITPTYGGKMRKPGIISRYLNKFLVPAEQVYFAQELNCQVKQASAFHTFRQYVERHQDLLRFASKERERAKQEKRDAVARMNVNGRQVGFLHDARIQPTDSNTAVSIKRLIQGKERQKTKRQALEPTYLGQQVRLTVPADAPKDIITNDVKLQKLRILIGSCEMQCRRIYAGGKATVEHNIHTVHQLEGRIADSKRQLDELKSGIIEYLYVSKKTGGVADNGEPAWQRKFNVKAWAREQDEKKAIGNRIRQFVSREDYPWLDSEINEWIHNLH